MRVSREARPRGARGAAPCPDRRWPPPGPRRGRTAGWRRHDAAHRLRAQARWQCRPSPEPAPLPGPTAVGARPGTRKPDVGHAVLGRSEWRRGGRPEPSTSLPRWMACCRPRRRGCEPPRSKQHPPSGAFVGGILGIRLGHGVGGLGRRKRARPGCGRWERGPTARAGPPTAGRGEGGKRWRRVSLDATRGVARVPTRPTSRKPPASLCEPVEAELAEDPEAGGTAMGRPEAAARQVDVDAAAGGRRVLRVKDGPQVGIRRMDHNGGVSEVRGPTQGVCNPAGHAVVANNVWKGRVDAPRVER